MNATDLGADDWPTYFSTQERIDKLSKVAATWMHTPFVPRGTIKGRGVDCISLVAMIYKEIGLISEYNPPKYRMDNGLYMDKSILEEEAEKSGVVRIVWRRLVGEFRKAIDFDVIVKPGDMITGKRGKVPHHSALVLGKGQVIHAILGAGVCYGTLRDPIIARAVETIYRPKP